MPLQNDEREVELVPFPSGAATVGWLRERVNIVLKKVYYTLHYLEGRLGKLTLRDGVGIRGSLALGSNYNSLTAPTDGAIIEGKVGIGTSSPRSPLDISSTTVGTGSANVELLTLSRDLRDASSTVAPPANFGSYIAWRLRGFTARTHTIAGKILTAWTNAQTNNTTDQDAYMAFSVAHDAALDEVMRLTSEGVTTTITYRLDGPSGERVVHGYSTELITIAAAATSTSVANLLPADSIIDAVVIRVTVAIPTAATFHTGDAAQARRFRSATSTAANTTAVGLNHMLGSVAVDTDGPTQAAAAQVVITPNAVPANNNGRVRVTVFWRTFTAPTS